MIACADGGGVLERGSRGTQEEAPFRQEAGWISHAVNPSGARILTAQEARAASESALRRPFGRRCSRDGLRRSREEMGEMLRRTARLDQCGRSVWISLAHC